MRIYIYVQYIDMSVGMPPHIQIRTHGSIDVYDSISINGRISLYRCRYVWIYHLPLRLCISICVYLHIYISRYLYAHTDVQLYVHIYICVCVSVYGYRVIQIQAIWHESTLLWGFFPRGEARLDCDPFPAVLRVVVGSSPCHPHAPTPPHASGCGEAAGCGVMGGGTEGDVAVLVWLHSGSGLRGCWTLAMLGQVGGC